jgi:hypothetical protein
MPAIIAAYFTVTTDHYTAVAITYFKANPGRCLCLIDSF